MSQRTAPIRPGNGRRNRADLYWALIWIPRERTHCRYYAGPYYLAMITPVLVLALGSVSAGFYGWFVLGILIFAGGKTVWWPTERAWGELLYI
jgi:hypothetical protein